MTLLLCRHQVINAHIVLQSLLDPDEEFNPIHHELHELHFCESNGLLVAYFVQSVRVCVDRVRATNS